MRKGRVWFVWLVLLLLVGLGAAFWYMNGQPDNADTDSSAPKVAAVAVEVSSVRSQRLTQQVTAVGSLVAQQSTVLRAESSGRIAEITFKEGSPVEKGERLVQLDTDLLSAELQQAKARFALVNSQAQRAQKLRQEGFISAQAVDESTSERAVAAAEVNIIQTRIDKSQIKAPFDGVLGLRYVNVGDYISNGDDIVSLASVNELQVDIRVPEHYLSQVQVGTAVHVYLDAQPGQQFQGEVNAISPMLDEQGRSIVLRALIANPDGVLRPGQFARLLVDLGETDGLMVPETAIAPAGRSQYVYRVTDNNKAEQVEVTVGIRRDGWVQVSGLSATDRVLVSGLQKVQDGSEIRFNEAEK